MKKILSVILVVVLLVTAMPLGAFEFKASAETLGYITYSVSNGEATITDCDTSISGDITIPSTLGGAPVTSIGVSAFYGCFSLTSITIPNSVISIGHDAFNDCYNLTSITIPNSVTSIAYDAFYNTGYYNNADNWEDNVLYIGNHLIKAKTSISGSYTIKENTVTIASYAFSSCFNLTSITIPDSVSSIGSYAFEDCSHLTSITILDGVTSIGTGAFKNCSSLTSITIPDSVTSIGKYAFEDCSSLESITIPDSVTSIGLDVFYNTGYYNNADNWEDNILYIGNHLIKSKTSISGSYTIKENTVTIASYAFYGCSSLKNMTLPDSITSIGSYAFEACTSLTSINIPDGVTSIGAGAFYGCFRLTSINIPDSVTSIDVATFSYCSRLTSITIPDGVISIGDAAFYECSSLTSVTIPDSVTSIGGWAFFACTSLTNIIIPDSITSIGFSVFTYCTSLTSITIPDSVTSIDNYAFDNCTSLTNVYYRGSREDKSKISISSYNNPLTNATWYYNCCIVHTYDNACDTICNVCDVTRTTNHTYDNDCDSVCNICDYERTPEPHKVLVDSLCSFENEPNYPFSLSGGIYSSTNKAHSSTATVTLTAIGNGSLTIRYYTSTESNYDNLIIKHNSSTMVTASGETDWKSTTLSVVAGDKIYITYSKDSSVSRGSDEVKFELSSAGYALADTVEPTCKEAVVCDICGELVKAALAHTYDNAYDTDCNVCGYKKFALGDIDGTGAVDLSDVNALARYLAGWNVDCNEAALDVNGDGAVNLKDLVHLSQYAAGWNVVLH